MGGIQTSLHSVPPFLGMAVTIQHVLQDCGSPESNGSPEPRRPAASEAASGSQEKLDFNRNLQEGEMSVPVRGGHGGGVRMTPLTPLCLPVVPAIEKLLCSDWKERFLGRSSVETKDVKGESPWNAGRGDV